MKTKLYLLLVMMAFMPVIQAQITLTSPSSSTFIQKDTFTDLTNLTDYESFGTAKANGSWDFTLATYPPSVTFTYERLTPSSTVFTTASYARVSHYDFAGSLRYSILNYDKITATEMVNIGEEIPSDQVLSIQMLTGNANDKLVFPKQAIQYSANEVMLKYPTKLGDNWGSKVEKSTNFNLTVTAYALNNTPGVFKSIRERKDTVIGWGTIDLYDRYAEDTIRNIKVLQIRQTVAITDSFFLGGAPAPVQLLTAFGLTQGQVTYAYTVEFYREGEVAELAKLDYKESPFKKLDKAYVHQNRLNSGTSSVHNIQLTNSLKSFPNPITNNQIQIELPASSIGDWNFSIFDIFGRPMLQGTISNMDNRIATIDLQNKLTAGQYFLQISKDNQMVSNNPFVVQP